MINTYHTSFNPPPVPPRAGYSKPRPPGNTPLVKFLTVMLLLLMILTFGGFLYLFQKLNVELQESHDEGTISLKQLQDCVEKDCQKDWKKVLQANGKMPMLGTAAHLVLQNEHKDKSVFSTDKSDFLKPNVLLWDRDHSLLEHVRLNPRGDILTIENPGVYFIYSQVTFSRRSSSSLKQGIWSRTKNKDEKQLLRSYCSLNQSTPDLCTASMTGIFKLHKDQELFVTVTNTTLVNRDSSSFGLFKLF